MSQYGLEFRLTWVTSFSEFNVRVSIYETDYLIDDSETPEVIELTPTASPLVMSTIDNDRNKFLPIRAKQAKISFLTGDYDINTFFDSPDNRWLVVITLPDSGLELFRGYLVLADISQPFLPDPVEVTLIATDKLGTLKDIPLVNNIGLVPTGHIKWWLWFHYALTLTGLNLESQVQFNVRNVDTNDFHLFDKNYIHALTFEDEVGTMINCYEVLERLLGQSGFVTQYKGKWFIKRIDEFDNTVTDYIAQFNTDAEYVSIDAGTTYLYNIGGLSNARWCNANQLLSSDRPHDNIRLDFRYEFPKEMPCNVDFERGDFIADIDASTKKYEIDCWDFQEHKANGQGSVAPNGNAYIVRHFNAVDYEDERYVEIDEGTGVHNPASLKSERLEVKQGDKIGISLDFRLNADVSDLIIQSLGVELRGHNGSYWYMLETGFWFEYPALPYDTLIFMNNEVVTGADTTQWDTISVDTSNEVPTDGYLYIYLLQNTPEGATKINLQNLQFTLYPKVNGSNKKYTGQYQKYNRTDDGYIPAKKEQVYIGDVPHPMYKGGIFWFDSLLTNRYVLGTQFYDHTESPLVVPPTISGRLMPYGQLQAVDFWNQYKHGFRILEGDAIGLDDDNPPDVIHRYIFTDINPNINGRTFMCLSYEQDWKTEKWRGTFVEVYRNSAGRTYDDPHEFKYLTNG